MNPSNFEHAAFALLMQIAIGLVTGNWWAGAAAGAFFFLGREHAQFEKKLTNGGPVGNLNPFAGFQFWKWNLDSQLDLVFPVVATLAVAAAYEIGVQVTFYPLFALLVVLNILDVILTVRILDKGGRELNPVMAAAMRAIGVKPALILFKAAVLIAGWNFLPGSAYSSHIVAGLCLLYAFVVWNNWRHDTGRA